MKKTTRMSSRGPQVPKPKLFKAVSWYAGSHDHDVGRYVAHLLMELGRLGMDVHEIESTARAPHCQMVLSDLLDWFGGNSSSAMASLTDWMTIDREAMCLRLDRDGRAKPRIEISATITKMANLSVRWHPGGWRDSIFDWNQQGRNEFNLITQKTWPRPPDFRWFTGDEQPYFDSRPTNELMYLRGVGNLRPVPRAPEFGYETYNRDVVHACLLCCVRAAYESLIARLRLSFEVEVLHGFDFTIVDEPYGERSWEVVHRVVGWSLEDANLLAAQRAEQKAERTRQEEQRELAAFEDTHEVALTSVIAALVRVDAKAKARGAVDVERINREAAKELRAVGAKIDAGHVRRLRELLARHQPEDLPEVLRPAPESPMPSPPSNVVPLSRPGEVE